MTNSTCVSNTIPASSAATKNAPKPDEHLFKDQILKASSAIEAKRVDLEATNNSIKEITSTALVVNNNAETNSKVLDINVEIELLESQAKSLQSKLTESRTNEQRFNSELLKLKQGMKYPSIQAVKDKIAELRFIIERQSMTLDQEKAIFKEISSVTKALPDIKKKEKEIAEYEQRRPKELDTESIHSDLAGIKSKVQALRKEKSALVTEMREKNAGTSAVRDERRSALDVLFTKREELQNDIQDMTEEVIRTEEIFNSELRVYKENEADKRRRKSDKMRIKRKIAMLELERDNCRTELDNCVGTDVDSELASIRILIKYCEDDLASLEENDSTTPKNKKQKRQVDIHVIREFAAFGLSFPESAEELKNASEKLQNYIDAANEKSALSVAAVAERRSELEKKLADVEAKLVVALEEDTTN